MKKLAGNKHGGKLRKGTNLGPIMYNATRWASKCAMLKRYNQLINLLDDSDPDLDELIP